MLRSPKVEALLCDRSRQSNGALQNQHQPKGKQNEDNGCRRDQRIGAGLHIPEHFNWKCGELRADDEQLQHDLVE